MMKIIFDIDVVSPEKYGMIYATFGLMKAVQKLGHEVVNYAAGREMHLKEHRFVMEEEGFETRTFRTSRKILTLLNKLPLRIEERHLGNYDIFVQVGLHQKRRITQKKYVVFIHDTVGLRYPEQEPPFPAYAQSVINRARLVLTVSEFSKSEILHYFEINPEKVRVVPNGCDLNRFKIYSPADRQRVKEKYRLPDHYLVCYGGRSARKNIKTLVKAYAEWKHPNRLPLVFFGRQDNINEQGIMQLGYLNDDDVPIVLSGAEALVFPSYYEGYGLPVIEAFACGVPVICAQAASLPEVSKGNAVFFNPFEPIDIVNALTKFVENPALHKKLRDTGLTIARQATWKASAKQFIQIVEGMV